MSDAHALLSDLTQAGVSITVEGADLVLDGNRPVILDRLPAIRRLKPALLELLRRPIWRWRVIEADGREMEATVTPWATLAEMREAHPDALVIAPLVSAQSPCGLSAIFEVFPFHSLSVEVSP